MLVLLNPRAGYGRAASRWDRIKRGLEARFGTFEVVEATSLDGAGEQIRSGLARGESTFVAAGGDGTVNLLVNAVMTLDDPSGVVVGAVGLGSSNDFHKPFSAGAQIEGVPVRVDSAKALARDVIEIECTDGSGSSFTRYAIINASLGITAEANAAFNDPSRFVKGARALGVDAAIVASILETLSAYRDIECRLTVDGVDEGTFPVSNLGIIKSPHFAGALCYDTPVEPDDGKLGVNLSWGLSRLQALALLAALYRGRFRGRPRTRSWTAERLRVEADRTFALETDGEVVRATTADFSVLPGKIRCCA